MTFSSRTVWNIGLVPVLVLAHAIPATAQYSPLDPFGLDVELVGVTVDLEDGESIGDCTWYETRPPGRSCAVTLATFQRAGVPIVAGREANLTMGQFGSARYRLAGRITRLRFQLPRGERTLDTGFAPPAPVEERIATDGSVLPAVRPPARVRNRVRVPPRREYVTSTLAWSMYDTVTGELVATDEVKGGATQLGEAIYDSYVRFLEAMRGDLADR